MSSFGNEDVCWLNVTMDDARGVSGIERVGDLDTQREDVFGFQRTAGDTMFQRHPVQELHGDEGLTVRITDVVDGADVGMVQGRSRSRFALKSGNGLGMASNFRRQELERREPVQSDIFGLIDDTHAAAAELVDDVVMGEGLADKGIVGLGWVVVLLGHCPRGHVYRRAVQEASCLLLRGQ